MHAERIRIRSRSKQAKYVSSDSSISDDVPIDLRRIIQSLDVLPSECRSAPFAYVESRILNKARLRALLSQPAPTAHFNSWEKQIGRRKAALTPYIGKKLFCILIRLSRNQYTIEIDPDIQNVVHWEWVTI